jgi:hypothetical protein
LARRSLAAPAQAGTRAPAALCLCQVLPQRLPIIRLPATFKMLALFLGESGLVEDDTRFRTLTLELEPNDGKNAIVPVDGTPRLDDSLIWHQFEVASDNVPAETGKCAAGFMADLGRCAAAQVAELRGTHQRFIDALWYGLEYHLMMNGALHLSILRFVALRRDAHSGERTCNS